jgi:hypothetical protein
MPHDVILRINQIGQQQGMPSTLTFSDRHGNEILTPLRDIDSNPEFFDDDDDSTFSHHSTQTGNSTNDDDDSLDDDFVSEHSDTDLDNVEPNLHHPDNISDHASSSSDNSSAAETDSSDHDDDDPPGSPPPPPVPHAAVTPAPHASSDSDTVVTRSRNPGVNYTPSSQEYENDDEDWSEQESHVPQEEDLYPLRDENSSVASNETLHFDTPTPFGSPGVNAREIPGVPLPPTIYEHFQQAEQHGRDAANGYTIPSRPQRTKRTTRTNEYLYLTVLLNTLDPGSDELLFSLVTEQMTAHQGVKRFGEEAGKHAIAKELEQLLTRRVLHGVPSTQLNPALRKAALRYLMFLRAEFISLISG